MTVELADADSGRVTHRETVDNFLSLQSLKVAKWWQRMMWGAFLPVETLDAAGNRPSEMPWFPAQHLAYWNDATAEDAGTEDRINVPIVGWASRHPLGSPSGKRGVVNITESTFSDSAAKWVMDWSTSQGNGTFQSIGWTRLDEYTQFLLPQFPSDDGLIPFTQANAFNSAWAGPIHWDVGGSLWYVSEWNNVNVLIKTAAPAGGALTLVTTLPTWAIGGSFPSFRSFSRIGTDIISVGDHNGTLGRIMRHTSAGVQVWTANVGTPFIDCCVDGSSNIWTITVAGIIRRHSNVDGSITATVVPAALSAFTYGGGIAYDPADGNLWVFAYGTVTGSGVNTPNLLWKMDSSGNTIGPCYSLSGSPQTATTSTTPWVGTYEVPAARPREPYHLTLWKSSALAGSNIARATLRPVYPVNTWPAYGGVVTVKDGYPYISDKGSTGTVSGAVQALTVKGGTLGTRSKLASAVTKTSSQTLKITYQFNFS